ncbi:MAG: FHA domain-containing protein [Pseudomonadota bacterium]
MSADPSSVFTLFIKSGIHAGTVQRLSPGIYTLGSELDADIILSDTSIKPVHLLLEFDHRGLRLEPLQGAIAIEGESAELTPGGERNLAFPGIFSVGETSIRITAPQDDVRKRRRVRSMAIAAGAVLLAVVGLQLVGPFGGVGDSPTIAATSSLDSPPDMDGQADNGASVQSIKAKADHSSAGADVEDGASEAALEPEITLDDAAAALRERLAADGFANVDVKTAVDRIMVSGEAEPARMDAWQDIRFWFDSAFGQDILLIAHVEPAEEETPPLLAIEAVWAGDEPYLIAGGRRFAVGADIGDGWTIERIAADAITFRRGDRSFSLTL